MLKKGVVTVDIDSPTLTQKERLVYAKEQVASTFKKVFPYILAGVANEVWHEFFPCILSDEQIDYMVDKFQSYDAMKKQMEDGYEYYFVKYPQYKSRFVSWELNYDYDKEHYYYTKYEEDAKDLLVELEEYIVSIDKDELDQLHPEYRDKMAILDLEEVREWNGKCFLAIEFIILI